jgi:xylulokinase
MTLVAGIDSSTQSYKVLVVDAASGTVVRDGRAAHPEGTKGPGRWAVRPGSYRIDVGASAADPGAVSVMVELP